MSTKLKAIRTNFHHAVDSGSHSGHGRVVYVYLELCEAVWGGSPATCEINTGVESGEIASVDNTVPSNTEACDTSQADGDRVEDSATASLPQCDSVPSVVPQKRSLLNTKLAKLKRKLPTDIQQFLNVLRRTLRLNVS